MDEHGIREHGMDGTGSDGGDGYGVGSGGVGNGNRRRWAERPGEKNRAQGGAGVGDDDDDDDVRAEGWRERPDIINGACYGCLAVCRVHARCASSFVIAAVWRAVFVFFTLLQTKWRCLLSQSLG